MTRYFKATDSLITVFRATKAGAYVSAGMRPVAFSKAMKPGYFPTVEITKAEYATLVSAKARRVAADWLGRDPKHWPDYDAPPRWWGNGPQDSWVRNADIA